VVGIGDTVHVKVGCVTSILACLSCLYFLASLSVVVLFLFALSLGSLLFVPVLDPLICFPIPVLNPLLCFPVPVLDPLLCFPVPMLNPLLFFLFKLANHANEYDGAEQLRRCHSMTAPQSLINKSANHVSSRLATPCFTYAHPLALPF